MPKKKIPTGERGIRYRADRDAWYVQIVNAEGPDGVRHTVRRAAILNTREGAASERRLIYARIAAGTWGAEGPRTFSAVVDEFLESKRLAVQDDDGKESTVGFYELLLRVHLRPALGDKLITKVKAAEIDALKKALFVRPPKKDGTPQADRKPGAVATSLRTLRAVLRFAVDRGSLAAAPKVLVPGKSRKKTAKEVRHHPFLTFEQADVFLKAAAAFPELEPICWLATRAGLRVGEILALKWTDFGAGFESVNIQRAVYEGRVTSPKGNQARMVPLTKATAAILKAYRTRAPVGPVWLFEDGKSELRTRHQLRGPLHDIADAAEVPRFGIHLLRHTCASHLAMRGVSLIEIRDILGHSSIEQTEEYAHLMATRRSVVQLLDAPAPS